MLSKSIEIILFKLAFKFLMLKSDLYLSIILSYLFKSSSSKLIFELKFDFNLIPFSKFNFTSPSKITRSSKFP